VLYVCRHVCTCSVTSTTESHHASSFSPPQKSSSSPPKAKHLGHLNNKIQRTSPLHAYRAGSSQSQSINTSRSTASTSSLASSVSHVSLDRDRDRDMLSSRDRHGSPGRKENFRKNYLDKLNNNHNRQQTNSGGRYIYIYNFIYNV